MRIFFTRMKLTAVFITALFAASAWALPPQAEADKLMIEAKAAMDAHNFALAAQKFARVQALNVRVPETFAYHYGVALSVSGELDLAKQQLDSYITKAGSAGKFYKEALEIYAQTEAKQAEIAAKQDFIDSTTTRLAAVESKFLQWKEANYSGSTPPAEFSSWVSEYRSIWEAYDKKIMQPGIERLQTLMEIKKGKMSMEAENEAEIQFRKSSQDVGLLANRSNSVLAKLYAGLEKSRLKIDARAIEEIRLKSYLYPRMIEKGWSFDEAKNKVQRGREKFEQAMSEW